MNFDNLREQGLGGLQGFVEELHLVLYFGLVVGVFEQKKAVALVVGGDLVAKAV